MTYRNDLHLFEKNKKAKHNKKAKQCHRKHGGIVPNVSQDQALINTASSSP